MLRRLISIVSLLSILLAGWGVNSLYAAAQSDHCQATRVLPSRVSPGETFTVTLTFTAPSDEFNAIGLRDSVPAGWVITLNNQLSTPQCTRSNITGSEVEYIWFGPYTAGTSFVVVYNLTVSAAAEPGTDYFFGSAAERRLEYYVAGEGPYCEDIGGQDTVAISGSTTGGSGGGGGGNYSTGQSSPEAAPGSVNGFGSISVESIRNQQGIFSQAAVLHSDDNQAAVVIAAGTTGTLNGTPLDTLSVDPISTPPAAGAGLILIGTAYDFSPDGAVFDPSVTLTLYYDPAAVWAGIPESDLLLAFYDPSTREWVVLPDATVDVFNRTVTARIDRFALFSLAVPVDLSAGDLIPAGSLASLPTTTPDPASTAAPTSTPLERPATGAAPIPPPEATPALTPLPEPAEPRTNWGLLIGIAVGVLIAGALAWYLFRRQSLKRMSK